MKSTKILATILAAAIACTALAACGEKETKKSDIPEQSVYSETEAIVLPEGHEMTDELTELFDSAVGTLTGVAYTPKYFLGLASDSPRVYCFLCESAVVNPDAIPYWSLVYVSEETNGSASVSAICVPEYTASGDTVTVGEESGELPAGGWSANTERGVDQEIEEMITEAMGVGDRTAVEFMASQVVAGMNYCILCENITDGSWEFVYIYKDLQGNCELLNVALLDVEGIYESGN